MCIKSVIDQCCQYLKQVSKMSGMFDTDFCVSRRSFFVDGYDASYPLRRSSKHLWSTTAQSATESVYLVNSVTLKFDPPEKCRPVTLK